MDLTSAVLQHLRLPLEQQDHRPAHPAYVQGLVILVQYQDGAIDDTHGYFPAAGLSGTGEKPLITVCLLETASLYWMRHTAATALLEQVAHAAVRLCAVLRRKSLGGNPVRSPSLLYSPFDVLHVAVPRLGVATQPADAGSRAVFAPGGVVTT